MSQSSEPTFPLDLATRAREHPDALALVMGNGMTLSYRALDVRSNRVARLLRSKGLATGDHIAILMGNGTAFLEVAWAR